ncbi:MAG: LysM domain-containing protein, partial [Tepidisphaeraceae bacterium]
AGLATNTLAGATQAGSTQPPAQSTVSSNATDNLTQGPSAAGGRTHVVKAGETFSSIAAAAYGSPNFYPHIQRANPSLDSTRLKPGMTITLPLADEVKPAASPAVAVAEQKIDPRTQYKVQPSDSLYRISEKLYGKADRVEKLYEANKAAIGDDMARLKAGMILKLPEPPTQSTEATTAR